MKNTFKIQIGLSLLLGASYTFAAAERSTRNRLTVSPRVGYFIDADIRYGVDPVAPPPPRLTPDGDTYNYDNGYVLPGSNGGLVDQTWYWGYDDPAQVAGNNILMSRTTSYATESDEMEMNSPSEFSGVELVYSREIQIKNGHRFGFDVGTSYLPIKFEDRSQFFREASTTTDEYAFTPGTTPPGAPYQGSFNGPGFVIGSSPIGSAVSTAPGGPVVNARSDLDGALWGVRVGPYMESPMGDSFFVHFSGGLSLAWLEVDVDWSNDGATPGQRFRERFSASGRSFHERRSALARHRELDAESRSPI